MESLPSPQNSKKRMLLESVSSSRSMDDDDVVVLIDPPVTWTRKPRKGKEAVVHDVIKIDDDEGSDTAMFMNKKRIGRSYEKKPIKYSSDDYLDHQAKGAVANNFVSSGKSSSSASHKVASGDLFLDEVIDVDEYAELQSHLDDVNIPPGVEAPIPWSLDPRPPKHITNAVSGSSSFDTEYQAANSFASASHNVIGINSFSSGASHFNSDYAGLYLDEFIDIDEYAQMTAYFDEVDVTPGIEALFPLGLSSSDFRGSVKPVSGSSSSLKSQHYGVSHPLRTSSLIPPQVSSNQSYLQQGGASSFGSNSSLKSQNYGVNHPLRTPSSLILPQVSSNQSYLQQQGSASSFSLGAESSKLQTQTQNDVSVNQVSRMTSDKTVGKVDGFKQFDTVEDHSDHHYTMTSHLAKQKNWAKKIQQEWKILENNLPDTISVRVYETRMDLLRAVIVGAEGTPYHDGLFFFDISFPSGYPNGPPYVYYHAHGLRLNPNLYDCGKVCLSLLNTWSGGKQEKWIPGTSTMLQVLISIQGLILNSEPYFNEPGWAPMKGTPSGEMPSKKYNEDTLILSLRTMVYIMKKPPKHFEEFAIGHFRNRAHDILGACKAYMDGAQVGSLVKGKIQGVKGSKSCSEQFKNSLAGFLPTLVAQFTQIGVKDCEKFLQPTTVRNMQNIGSKDQAARSTVSWATNNLPWAMNNLPHNLFK